MLADRRIWQITVPISGNFFIRFNVKETDKLFISSVSCPTVAHYVAKSWVPRREEHSRIYRRPPDGAYKCEQANGECAFCRKPFSSAKNWLRTGHSTARQAGWAYAAYERFGLGTSAGKAIDTKSWPQFVQIALSPRRQCRAKSADKMLSCLCMSRIRPAAHLPPVPPSLPLPLRLRVCLFVLILAHSFHSKHTCPALNWVEFVHLQNIPINIAILFIVC